MKNKFPLYIITVLTTLLLLNLVNADLNQSLFAYWDMDEGSGSLLHERANIIDHQNGTITGTYYWKTGILGNSLEFNKSVASSYVDDMGSYTPYQMRSFSVWFYPLSSINSSNAHINTVFNLDNTDNYALKIGGNPAGACTNEVLAWVDISSRTCYENISFNFEPNTWYHVVGIYNNTNNRYELYLNGELLPTFKDNTVPSPFVPLDLIIADTRWEDGTQIFDGRIDELGFWNRTLTQADIDELYNSGSGYNPLSSDITPPVITLNTPPNNTHVNVPVNLTVSITDSTSIKNVTLFILNATSKVIIFQDTETFIGSPTSINYGYIYNFTEDDDYLWYYQSSDGTATYNLGSSSQNRTIIKDGITPLITFYNPVPYSNPFVSNPSFVINATVEDDFLDAINITIYDENGTETYNNYTENLTATFMTIGDSITLSEGLNIIDISARDSLESSPTIKDITETTKTSPNNEDEYFDIKINGVTVRRTSYIVSKNKDKAKKLDWDLEGKHIKTDISSKKLQDSDWSVRIDLECLKGCSYMELLTDRGRNRIVDNNRNLYFDYSDAVKEGWKVSYLENNGVVSVIIAYPNLFFFNSLDSTQTIDPIIAGLNSYTRTENITLDTTNPTISITYPTNTTYTSNVTSLEYTYEEINPDSCWYSTDYGVTNSTPVSCGTNFTLTSSEGDNHWIVYINDSVGLISSDSVDFNTDTISPVVNIVYPTSTIYEVNVTSLDYTATSTGILDVCWYSLDSGVTNSTTQTCGTNWTFEAGEGTYTWTVYANDSFNRIGYDSVNFEVEYPSTDRGFIYNIMVSVGAGLSIFIQMIANSLPLLLIGLAIVVIISIIGFALAKSFKSFKFWGK